MKLRNIVLGGLIFSVAIALIGCYSPSKAVDGEGFKKVMETESWTIEDTKAQYPDETDNMDDAYIAYDAAAGMQIEMYDYASGYETQAFQLVSSIAENLGKLDNTGYITKSRAGNGMVSCVYGGQYYYAANAKDRVIVAFCEKADKDILDSVIAKLGYN